MCVRKGWSAEIHPCELMASGTRSFWRACSSCLDSCHSKRCMTTILSTRLNNKMRGTWWWSWAPGSRTRSVTHNDDRLRVPTEPQELSGHVSSGGQPTSYDRSDRWSDTTTDRDFIDDYPIIRVSPHWDPTNEPWRISNQEAINSSSKYSTINISVTIKSSSFSPSRTPLQPRLQHSPTAGVNLWDKSGLTVTPHVSKPHDYVITCLRDSKCWWNSTSRIKFEVFQILE
jgi:hypothetical protein